MLRCLGAVCCVLHASLRYSRPRTRQFLAGLMEHVTLWCGGWDELIWKSQTPARRARIEI